MTILQKLRLYSGFIYPVVGSRYIRENDYYKILFADTTSWIGRYIPFALKIRVFDPDKPFSNYAIESIMGHPEMNFTKRFYSNEGYVQEGDKEAIGYLWDITTQDGSSIGSIETAYGLTHLSDFDVSPESESGNICCGFHGKEQKWYGWSFRAIYGFGIGDRIFDPEYGDDKTPFRKHGEEEITTLEQAKASAITFAWYMS